MVIPWWYYHRRFSESAIRWRAFERTVDTLFETASTGWCYECRSLRVAIHPSSSIENKLKLHLNILDQNNLLLFLAFAGLAEVATRTALDLFQEASQVADWSSAKSFPRFSNLLMIVLEKLSETPNKFQIN